ncbi:hypothetical protein SAMN05428953_12128 [Mesorhizobium muleiense]|uniref:Uncharacterized protein n=1 Tax=Mesorhizobium muleiense TaxID=1004279 RepID=A0A1G9EZ59_9HYPH|nr:hypothetical protein SAMN05428953_12128 [Mesorhizobium muleiense]
MKKSAGKCLILGHVPDRDQQKEVGFTRHIVRTHDLRRAPNRLLESINDIYPLTLETDRRQHEHGTTHGLWRDYGNVSLDHTFITQSLQSPLTSGRRKARKFAQFSRRQAIVALHCVEKLAINSIQVHFTITAKKERFAQKNCLAHTILA